jgi:hypothetical protein
VLLKRIHVGTDQAFVCRISGERFAFADFAGRLGAERAAKSRTDSICSEQTAAGISPRATLRERRRAFRKRNPASVAS